MKKDDLIYKDEEYEIYKKGAGEIGTFTPGDCISMIAAATKELANWDNGGLVFAGYKDLIDRLCNDLQKTINYPKTKKGIY